MTTILNIYTPMAYSPTMKHKKTVTNIFQWIPLVAWRKNYIDFFNILGVIWLFSINIGNEKLFLFALEITGYKVGKCSDSIFYASFAISRVIWLTNTIHIGLLFVIWDSFNVLFLGSCGNESERGTHKSSENRFSGSRDCPLPRLIPHKLR